MFLVGSFASWAMPAAASPWAEVGYSQLRSDIEILASAGMVDGITTEWPLPWESLIDRLNERGAAAADDPVIRAAARRVQAAAAQAMHPRASVKLDGTSMPSVVRGFDAMGRQTLQAAVSVEYVLPTTAFRLSIGSQSQGHGDRQSLAFDDSYIAQKVGNAIVYAGYLTHWWGPGWTTALSLSSNARAFPQIGVARADTRASESPWLSWIGPWQAEFFVGVLDGPRSARNALFSGLRVAFNPLPGLEFALARTEQMCGTGHPCKPLAEFFNVLNDPVHPSRSKDETNFDVRYTGVAARISYAIYLQVMNRDTGPFTHSLSSHLFGGSVWFPIAGSPLRVTAEYADTISTLNLFSFGKVLYGATYTDYKYVDGWQYRNRTLGASLDTDSRLATLQASWPGPSDITYSLAYDRAAVGVPQSPATNRVSSAPVTINLGEGRVQIPFETGTLGLAARLQDDQPHPGRGFAAAAEASVTLSF